MGGLPALSIQPIQQESLLSKLGKMQQLKGQQQNLQEGQLDIEAKQRAAHDEQTTMQVLGKYQGDLGQALPELAQKVSASKYIALQKAHMEVTKYAADLAKTQAETGKDVLDAEIKRHDMLSGMVAEAGQMDPATYAQNWPIIAQRALALEPKLQGKVDPAQPIPQEQLAPIAAMFQTQTAALTAQKAKQEAAAAQRAEALAPSQLAESQTKAAQASAVFAGTNAQGITAEQRAQNALTKRGQDLSHAQNSGEDQAIEIAAKSLANGELTRLKDIVSLRGDQRLRVFARAKQINPNFSTAEIDRKIKMEDQFTSGKDGQNLQSFGTFLEHAGAASEMTNAYRTTSIKLVNAPLNKLRDLAGDASYNDFIGALEPVRKEFEGFLLGGRALYGDDRKAAETILSDNSSPAQIQAALTRMGHTVKARYNEANFRYKRTMGHDIEGAISPEALSGAKQIGVDMGGPSSGAGSNSKVIHYKIVNGQLVAQ